ncbi:albusnodin/ikarugamycin family macrolactam cyclase [Nocardiopsis sp. NPDC006938]|uniref:albusnodin/ikarugamycin family macrolactam cyclase n=1 Tax=Nocardiopsis sp. NPDC006938 TaxID=3364337 RepID=UPI00367583FF
MRGNMRWFGGFSGAGAAPRTPVHGRPLWPGARDCWAVGTRLGSEARTAVAGRRAVVVMGPCGASEAELRHLASDGVSDNVVWLWPGSYAVVLVTDESTTLWTDLGGAQPLYSVTARGGTYWASSSRALAGLNGGGPDLDRMAAWLLAPSVPALLGSRSSFAGVSLVPAGHRLTLPTYGEPSVRRVWRPQPRNGHPALRLRDELTSAVDVRFGSSTTPTTDLSGGYDSTSLALLAADAGHPVTGVTVHPAGRLGGGDLDYAHRAAEHVGISHRLIPLGAEHAPYSGLTEVPVTDEPAPSTIAHARFSGQLSWMREELGTDCHLTGDGGDSLLCSPPIMLADLVATGRVGRASVETVRWARLRRRAALPLLRSAHRTARTRRMVALRDLAVDLRAGRPRHYVEGDIGWCATEAVPPWATADARRRAGVLASEAAERSGPVRIGEFSSTMATEGIAEVGRSARADVQLAEWSGVALHNPFTDSRVIDAYLSVPLDARPGPAHYKPILGEAMANLFPVELARRSTKGDFNPDHYGGMRANLSRLHDLADGWLAALGLVDPARLRLTLSMTAAGVPVPFSTVEPAVAAEVWLRALDVADPVEWSAVGSETSAE